ncbi:MAG: dTDP-4-amino-4,6-dideoxygalactose transaminase, partial [Acidimicrobiales bacterium]
MPDSEIRFNQPTLEGREVEYIQQAVLGGHTSMNGPFAKRVTALLEDELDAAGVLLTTSCTDALEMAAMLLALEPGDTVIVPSFTFVSSALAFIREGAKIVFADIERETLGIDPHHVAELIDDSTRAVVAVHYAGVGCDVPGLRAVLADHPRIDLIEDNAHGLFGRFDGQPLGGFGRMSAVSFHETKSFTCGEGGALVLNDPADVERANILYEKGTDRRAFEQGTVDKYTWRDTGSSFGMSDILAAYLLGQLEARDAILAKRRAVVERYQERLAPDAAVLGFEVPVMPGARDYAYHLYYVLLEDADTRTRVQGALRTAGVQASFHFVPLHDSEGGRRFRAFDSDCPVTDEITSRLLRLPVHNA